MQAISQVVNTRNLGNILKVLLDSQLVPFVTSSPGMGKSSVIRALAKEAGLFLIDHRLSTSDPTDFSGLPGFDGKFAVMKPFEEIFPLAGTPVPAGYNGWLLFLDEFNSALKTTQAAAYKTILDRMVGQHHLHESVYVICAGNKATDRAIVNSLSTAMQSRLIHLEMDVNFEIWFEDVAQVEDYHPQIKAFLRAFPSKLMDFKPDHTDKTFCCPRTWEFMNKQVKATGGAVEFMLPSYAGTITSGVAVEFFQFTRVFDNLISMQDIIADPHNVPVPSDSATRWAIICSMLDWTTPANFGTLAIYANRFDMSFKVLWYRSMIGKHPSLANNPAFTAACVDISRYL